MEGSLMEQYSIYEANMERLENKLTRISNKCKQYGLDFTYRQVGEEFKEVTDPETGEKYTGRFIIVEAEGTAIINGWKFAASVEHTEKGNIINRIGDIEIPERYYTTKAICEHCQSNRFRKNTYIVMNEETGEFKQVGKSCLQDFTNGMSAEGVAYYISLFNELIQGEGPVGGCRGENYLKTEVVLRFVAETIKHFGYVRSNEYGQRSTASRAWDYYKVNHGGFGLWKQYHKELKAEMAAVGFNEKSADTVQLVADALAWLEGQDERNNYMHNLKTACSLEYVTGKNFGIIASLFPTFNRELVYQAEKAERERQRAAEKAAEANSKHIGKVGDRISFKVHSIACITSWETQWGITRVYKIVDDNGNVYTWKTSAFLDEEPIKTITGTVKEHKEFRGIAQTELTRCKTAA
jgi:cation transport regulator ChaC